MKWSLASLIGGLVKGGVPFAELVLAGNRARDAHDWGEAIAYYQAAVKKRPFADDIVVQLGHAYKESGYYVEAEACYRAFLKRHLDDADIHLQLGHLFLRQDLADEARAWYVSAQALASTDSQISLDARRGIEVCASAHMAGLRRYALELTDRCRFEDAYDVLYNLVERQGCEDLVGILGNVCKECGRLTEAAEFYDRYEVYAKAKAPEHLFDVAVQKGHLAKINRRFEEAISHFSSAQLLRGSRRELSDSDMDLYSEIKFCLGQITRAIELL